MALRVRLTDITLELESGGRPKGGAIEGRVGVLSVGGEHISADGSFLLETRRLVPASFYDTMRRGRIRGGDVLIVKDGATTGKVAFVDSQLPLPAAVNEHVFRLTVDPSRAEPRYVFYHLFSPVGNRQILEDFRGATVGGISQDFPEYVELPLPSLPEQQRIVRLLQHADRLRRARRYALELSDTFVAAAFLELFDGAARFPIFTVEELAVEKPSSIRTGPFGSQLLHSEFTDSGIAVLGIDNAVNNHFEWGERRFITPQKYEFLKRYTVRPGDVLITIMGTCGRCAVVPDNIGIAINTKHLCCITLDHARCLPLYLQATFLHHPFVQQQLGVSQKGAIMEGLNMEIIKNLKIPVPPLTRQEQFASLVLRHKRLRAKHREALRQADHLFHSLLHRAFA